ncbi:MAG: GNAT family N-acetyltransferase [Actinomycetota bacterium]|nr:GNAT family N-acetyltransferase [Actinomycetota bacterium]
MEFRVEARSYADPVVAQLVAAVQAEYLTRYGGLDEAAVVPGEFDPPGGLFLLGLLDGEAVATGGWRRINRGQGGAAVEIKRMFVVAAARRRGLARLILAELEATARAAGADQVVLNTGNQQPEAIALYESSGYSPVDGFGHYASHPGALFYGKAIG